MTPPVDIPITIDAGWSCVSSVPPLFNWGAGTPIFANDGPLAFTASGPVFVRVTDAFCTGDQFQLYDSGTPMGVTSAPPGPPTCLGLIRKLRYGRDGGWPGAWLLCQLAHSMAPHRPSRAEKREGLALLAMGAHGARRPPRAELRSRRLWDYDKLLLGPIGGSLARG